MTLPLLFSIAILLLVLALLPVAWSLAHADLRAGISALADVVCPSGEPRLRAALVHSLELALVGASLATLLSICAAGGWLQAGTGERRFVLGLVMVPLFVPETSYAVTTSMLIHRLGIDKGSVVTGIAVGIYALPFAAMLVLLVAHSISDSIWKAAHDLGIGPVARVRVILLPLIWPTVVGAWVFAFILCFNEYTRSSYLAGGEVFSTYALGAMQSGSAQAVYSVASAIFLVGAVLLGVLLSVQRCLLRRMGAS